MLLTFIKLLFVIKIFVLSIFECLSNRFYCIVAAISMFLSVSLTII